RAALWFFSDGIAGCAAGRHCTDRVLFGRRSLACRESDTRWDRGFACRSCAALDPVIAAAQIAVFDISAGSTIHGAIPATPDGCNTEPSRAALRRAHRASADSSIDPPFDLCSPRAAAFPSIPCVAFPRRVSVRPIYNILCAQCGSLRALSAEVGAQ